MSYTYPEALEALESVANEFLKILKPGSPRAVVVCDGRAITASVSWDLYRIVIALPAKPAQSRMTDEEFQDWVAYLLHEIGHPTFTDKATWEASVKAGLSRMVNALEDVRMERAVIRSGKVLNAKSVLSRLVSRKVAEARAAGDWSPNARKDFAWTICILGRIANGYAIDQSDVDWVKNSIVAGSTVANILDWAMPELAACRSTADCLVLAEKIGNALAAAKPQQPKPQPKPQAQEAQEAQEPQDDAQEAQGSDDSNDSDDAQNVPPADHYEDTDDNAQSAQSDDAQSDDAQSAQSEKHGSGTAQAKPDDEKPVQSENDLRDSDLAPKSREKKMQVSEAMNEAAVINILRQALQNKKPSSWKTHQGGNVDALRQKAAQASKQRAMLARALRANEIDDNDNGKRHGRLNRGALYRIPTGAQNVFQRRSVSEGFDTDVCILIDASGSMGNGGLASALEVGLVIAQAASSVGAACTTEIFNTRGFMRCGALASKRTPKVEDFAALMNADDGGTPLSPNIARMATAQAQRASGKRRVLFVVTDGGCDHGLTTVKRTAEYLEQALGTVLAHVSIWTPLQGAFKAEVQVKPTESITDVGLAHFVRVIQAL